MFIILCNRAVIFTLTNLFIFTFSRETVHTIASTKSAVLITLYFLCHINLCFFVFSKESKILTRSQDTHDSCERLCSHIVIETILISLTSYWYLDNSNESSDNNFNKTTCQQHNNNNRSIIMNNCLETNSYRYLLVYLFICHFLW